MELGGRRIPMAFSLLVWFVLWEVVGRLELVSLIPPFSSSIMAMAEVVPSRDVHRGRVHHACRPS